MVELRDNEFRILSFKLRLDASMESDSEEIDAQDVVEYVRNEVEKLKSQLPKLSDGQLAILTALKLAKDKLTLEQEFKENVTRLEATAKDALKYIEEVMPVSH